MDKEIVLILPLCQTNNLLCARLTTSAVCSLLNLDIDESDDIKVSVNEACLMIMGAKYKKVRLTYQMEKNLVINISGEGVCENSHTYDVNTDFALILLNSLIDEVKYDKDGGMVSSVTLTKRIK